MRLFLSVELSLKAPPNLGSANAGATHLFRKRPLNNEVINAIKNIFLIVSSFLHDKTIAGLPSFYVNQRFDNHTSLFHINYANG